MRKHRFPKAAYVRRLEALYAELGEWREHYGREGNEAYWSGSAARFVDRLTDLEDIQHELDKAIYALDNLSPLS